MCVLFKALFVGLLWLRLDLPALIRFDSGSVGGDPSKVCSVAGRFCMLHAGVRGVWGFSVFRIRGELSCHSVARRSPHSCSKSILSGWVVGHRAAMSSRTWVLAAVIWRRASSGMSWSKAMPITLCTYDPSPVTTRKTRSNWVRQWFSSDSSRASRGAASGVGGFTISEYDRASLVRGKVLLRLRALASCHAAHVGEPVRWESRQWRQRICTGRPDGVRREGQVGFGCTQQV